jgi:membrane-associated phospholipid phosphatase
MRAAIAKWFSASEFIVIAFLSIALLALLSKVLFFAQAIDTTGIRWSVFPKLDLVFITLSILSVKYGRDQPRLKWVTLFFLLFSFFAWSNAGSEAYVPLQDYFSAHLLTFLRGTKYFLLIVALGLFTMQIFDGDRADDRTSNRAKARHFLRDLRTVAPLFLMICAYPLIPILIGSHPHDQDSLLQDLDRLFFFGHDPLLLAEKMITPALSEWLAFCYSFYGFIFLVVFSFLFLKKSEKIHHEMIFAMTLTLALGYLGYGLVPAVGPVFSETFSVPLDLYYLKDIKAAWMDHTRIERDCFPSLHTAITLVSLFLCWKNLRAGFWIFLPIALSIPFACIYLRYHYVSDVLAGIGLAGFSCWAARRFTPCVCPESCN